MASKDKTIIFDASSLISLAMNGLLPELKSLKQIFKGSFLIPLEVRSEIIDKPMKVKRFELEALKLKQLLDEGVLELPSIYGVDSKEISDGAKEILDISNSTFRDKNRDIHIIDLGEAACLALSKILTKKGILNIISIDERTTRMLVEKPENLKKFLKRKLHIPVFQNTKNFSYFKGYNFIRSAELMYVAYKKGIVRLKDGLVLDALLYAVKFKGCAISDDEIREIKRIG